MRPWVNFWENLPKVRPGAIFRVGPFTGITGINYFELKTLKHAADILWQPIECAISLYIITCENRKYVGSFRVFVCLSVCPRSRGHNLHQIAFKI